MQALREAAAAALQGAPNHDLARAKLEEARKLVQAKREAVDKVAADQHRQEASLVREQARVEAARLRFAEAAQLCEQAARLLPAEDRDERAADWVSAGLAWTDEGRDFGNNAALIRAIAAYRAALEDRTRDAGAARLGQDAEQSRQRARGHSGSARAARRGWRRRSPPIGRRWRNAPASGCRSTGP